MATEVVPEAGQGRSYGMAALTYRGKPLLGFAAAKQHLSDLPLQPGRRGPSARPGPGGAGVEGTAAVHGRRLAAGRRRP